MFFFFSFFFFFFNDTATTEIYTLSLHDALPISRGFVIPSAGNAGGAAALYAARAGLPCGVIVPRGTPPAAIAEALIAGAHVFTIEGSIASAGTMVARVAPKLGWLDLSTLKEPYR